MSYCGEKCLSDYTPEEYLGSKNDDNQRDGRGDQFWKQEKIQKYSGSFLQDNLHGTGKYVWLRKIQSFLYEGGLYANNFEGYANLTYTDGRYFEGLMKRNERYGPGVLTYVDGSQDVGLWDGNNLRRLSCVVMPDWIPKLANSPSGKIKLFKYRKLVPITFKNDDLAKSILQKITSNPEVLEMSDQLYNKFVRNPNSNLFNKSLYDEKFFGEIDCTIEVATSISDVVSSANMKSDSNVLEVNKSADGVVADVIKYLIENVDILRQIPIDERTNILEENLQILRNEYRLESQTKFLKGIVETLLESLDGLFALSSEERKLILNKLDAVKRLPEQNSDEQDFPTKKVVVTDFLAWNNESILISMMRYIFINRNMENNVSFKVAKLLAGDRTQFNQNGEHEQNCITFLKYCSQGLVEIATELLVINDLNPDVSDAKGNSGITYAASRDRWNVIKMLTTYGGNIDILNDEGLTPLSLCLLRYLCVQKDIINWEKAFLTNVLVKADEETQVNEWYPHVSLTNVNIISSTSLTKTIITEKNLPDYTKESRIFGDPNKNSFKDSIPFGDAYDEIRTMEIDLFFRNFQEPYLYTSNEEQSYVFDAKCIIPPQEKSIKAKKGKKKEKKSAHDKKSNDSKIKKSKSKEPIQNKENVENFVKSNKLKIVLTTIKILLSCGANPNAGQVPVPCLTIVIFMENPEILKILLEAFANPNIPSLDDNTVPLHVIAALPFNQNNFEMFKMLLEYNADPNIKTNTYHWIDEKDKLIGKRTNVEDFGKTPLQILSMRYDFIKDENNYLVEMVKLLMGHDANLNEYYLGHTLLSLAVLRGNLKLVTFFLDTHLIDPNQKLGEDMGVALTVLILKRYNNYLPFDVCKNMYDLLIDYNVNPLSEIDEIGNAVEFMEKEYEEIKTSAKAKKQKKNRPGSSSKSSKKSKKGKSGSMEEIKQYLLRCARTMLQRHIQCKAFKFLMQFIREGVNPEEEIVEVLVKFFNLHDCQKIIQLLIHKQILIPSNPVLNISLQILELIEKFSAEDSRKLKKIEATPMEIILSLDWEKSDDENHFNLIEPEIDPNKEIYKVCFYCCQKINKVLILCPKCGLVYFCSEQCNKLSIKQKTIHNCKIKFYNDEKKKIDLALKNGYEYKPPSKLQDKLNYLNEILMEKYGDEADPSKKILSSDFNMDGFADQKKTAGGVIDGDGFGGLDIEKLKRESDEQKAKDIEEKIKRESFATKPDKFGKKDGAKQVGKRDDQDIEGDDYKTKKSDKSGKKEGAKQAGKRDDQDIEGDDYKTKKSGKSGKKEGADRVGKRDDQDVEGDDYKTKKSQKGEKDKSEGKSGDYGKDSAKGKSTASGKRKKDVEVLYDRKGERDSYTGKGRKSRIDDKEKSRKRENLNGRKSEKGTTKSGRRGSKSSYNKTERGKKGTSLEKTGGSKAASYKATSGKGGLEKKGGSKATSYKTTAGFGKRDFDGSHRSTSQKRTTGTGKRGSWDRSSQRSTSRKRSTSEGKYGQKTGAHGRTFTTDTDDQFNFPRLSNKYQYFMEKLSEFFPDFDLSMLFLPYACYCGGQLYYRFLDEKPIFIETYSNV